MTDLERQLLVAEAARALAGLQDLDERARLGALAQDGPGAQVGKRPDAYAIADHGAVMDTGVVRLAAASADLLSDPRVAELYLGARPQANGTTP